MREAGLRWGLPVKASVYHAQVSQGLYKKLPGKPVGVIAVEPVVKSKYNPLVLTFTVSPYRNDFKYVLMQNKAKDCLGGYAKSLFDSCFKNW